MWPHATQRLTSSAMKATQPTTRQKRNEWRIHREGPQCRNIDRTLETGGRVVGLALGRQQVEGRRTMRADQTEAQVSVVSQSLSVSSDSPGSPVSFARPLVRLPSVRSRSISVSVLSLSCQSLIRSIPRHGLTLICRVAGDLPLSLFLTFLVTLFLWPSSVVAVSTRVSVENLGTLRLQTSWRPSDTFPAFDDVADAPAGEAHRWSCSDAAARGASRPSLSLCASSIATIITTLHPQHSSVWHSTSPFPLVPRPAASPHRSPLSPSISVVLSPPPSVSRAHRSRRSPLMARDKVEKKTSRGKKSQKGGKEAGEASPSVASDSTPAVTAAVESRLCSRPPPLGPSPAIASSASPTSSLPHSPLPSPHPSLLPLSPPPHLPSASTGSALSSQVPSSSFSHSLPLSSSPLASLRIPLAPGC